MKTLVTPEIASGLLTRNTNNRILNKNAVKKYAADMMRGDWKYNHFPILIGRDGELLDGQHRLHAVVLSGVSIWADVYDNVDSDIMPTIDSGRPRTVANHLAWKGYKNTKNLGAMAKGVLMFDAGYLDLSRDGGEVTSHQNIIKTVENNSWIVDNARLAAQVSNSVHMGSGVFAVLWRMFDEIDPSDNSYFWQKLIGDTGHNEGDAIYALRKRLLNRFRNGVTWSDKEFIGVSVKAWNAYRLGLPVYKLSWRAGGSNPEEIQVPV